MGVRFRRVMAGWCPGGDDGRDLELHGRGTGDWARSFRRRFLVLLLSLLPGDSPSLFLHSRQHQTASSGRRPAEAKESLRNSGN